MTKLFFFLLLATIPFGAKFLLYQATPGFHEYETIFIYLSDVALVLFLVTVAIPPFRGKCNGDNRRVTQFKITKGKHPATSYLLLAILIFSAFSIFWAPAKNLAAYYFLRLAVLVLMTFGFAKMVSKREVLEKFFVVLAIFAVIQSVIGFLQFQSQDNLDLQILGESPIAADDQMTSKVALGGFKLVRAYGTFPHPNVLAAFLLLGLLSLFHFYFHTSSLEEYSGTAASYFGNNFYKRLLIAAGIFVVSVGIIVTFSRAAWLTGFLATLPFIVFALRRDKQESLGPAAPQSIGTPPYKISKFWFEDKTKIPPSKIETARRAMSLRLLVGLVAINYLIFAILGWAILPRITLSLGEPAVLYRMTYNELAINLIANRPLGVGIGNQVFYSYQSGLFDRFGLDQSWQWQPIHNLYLLIGSEIGILGLLAFLVFCALLLFKLLRGNIKLEQITALVFLGSVLILGLFDHYFWTLEQGRLMMWLVIGLALAASRPHSIKDNTQASGV